MSSPSKIKGSTYERAVVAYLAANGFPATERMYGAGRPADIGDIRLDPRVVIEAKACKTMDLAGWCDEAGKERDNAGAVLGLVVAKRRMKPVEESYVITTLREASWLLKAVLR